MEAQLLSWDYELSRGGISGYHKHFFRKNSTQIKGKCILIGRCILVGRCTLIVRGM